ncbi:hypothetical protein O5286_29235, partial [Escherichia coli]|nr:hypothetical protein [Escherichia coli]
LLTDSAAKAKALKDYQHETLNERQARVLPLNELKDKLEAMEDLRFGFVGLIRRGSVASDAVPRHNQSHRRAILWR